MRRRVSRVAIAAVLVSLILLAIPFAIGIRVSFFAGERSELERAALAAAVQVGPDFTANDPVELPPAMTDGQVAVYDRSLHLRAGSGPAVADGTTRAGLEGHVVQGQSGDSLVVAVPVASSEKVIGVVRASSAVGGVWNRILLAWLAVLGAVVVALLVGVGVATWQARRLSAPLEALARTADAVTAGDLFARADLSGIREVDAVARAQNTMVERLSAVLGQARHFAADAAHQLRTPLAGLRLTLESAQSEPAAEAHAALAGALQRTGELQQTVQDVLDLSRSSADGPRGVLGTVESLLADAEHRWHGLLAEHGRRITFEADAAVADRNIPLANCRQILDVLIDNARTHGQGTIQVQAHDTFDATTIDVADEGTIDSDSAQLFDPKPHHAGPRIGLRLARELVEVCGGRLVLAAGAPTTFRVLIPGEFR
ncbi:HAMP domain-containing sensor histidine kinase [Kribbella hippodromi]|uniref:histidine kinase n=1 Tax=Kribbella hippodromi TaxID=434347 RepID=A0ABP4NJZ3_9ACTN